MTKGRQFPWRPAHSVVHWTWVWSPLRCSPQQTTSEEPGLSLFTDILGRYPAQPRKRLHVTLQERLQLFMQACPHKRHAAVVQTQAEQMHHRGDAGQHHLSLAPVYLRHLPGVGGQHKERLQ